MSAAKDSRVVRQRAQRRCDGRSDPLGLAQAEVAFVAHGAPDRVQRQFLDLVPEIDEHVAEADEVEQSLARRSARR